MFAYLKIISTFFNDKINVFYATKFLCAFVPVMMYNKNNPEIYITKLVLAVNIILAMLFDINKKQFFSFIVGIVVLVFLYLVEDITGGVMYAYLALYTLWNLLFCRFFLNELVMGITHNFFPLCIAVVSDYNLHQWLMVRCIILSYGTCCILLFKMYNQIQQKKISNTEEI